MSAWHLLTADLPPVTGSPGLTQGRYGAAGNLELVIPAVDDGLWVFWFNADPVDARSGAAAGEWSTGLHFGAGAPVADARISQMDAGPNYLEVLARSGTQVRRHVWTPSDGFVDRGNLPVRVTADVTAVSAVVEVGTAVHVLAGTADGRLVHLSAGLDSYPDLDWHCAAMRAIDDPVEAVDLRRTTDGLRAVVCAGGVGAIWAPGDRWAVTDALAGRWHAASLLPVGVVGLGADSELQLAVAVSGRSGEGYAAPVALCPGRTWAAAGAAQTSLDGGRTDVVAVADGQLWHLNSGSNPLDWSAPRRIVSRVWSTGPGPAEHRRTAGPAS